MKPWKFFTHKLKIRFKPLGQRGQTIVEFALLLLVLTSVSFFFVAIVNYNIAERWEYIANLVRDDGPNGPKEIKIRE